MARKDSIQNLRAILIKRRDALTRALAGDQSMLRELRGDFGGDVVDFALDTAHEELNSQLAEFESRELAHIQYALEKIKDGTYGKCEGCNCNIPMARLQALPYATQCVKCKRETENSGKDTNANPDWGRIVDPSKGDDVRLGDMDFNVS